MIPYSYLSWELKLHNKNLDSTSFSIYWIIILLGTDHFILFNRKKFTIHLWIKVGKFWHTGSVIIVSKNCKSRLKSNLEFASKYDMIHDRVPRAILFQERLCGMWAIRSLDHIYALLIRRNIYNFLIIELKKCVDQYASEYKVQLMVSVRLCIITYFAERQWIP